MSMTMPEIERALKQLRLSGVRATLETRVLQAQSANQAFLETFSLILLSRCLRRNVTDRGLLPHLKCYRRRRVPQ